MAIRSASASQPSAAVAQGRAILAFVAASALRGICHAKQAKEAVVHGVAGVFDGHPPGFHLLFRGAAEGQAGGQQPAGRQGGVEIATFLPSPDQLEHPVEDWGVPAGILLGAYCRQMPDEGVAGGDLPAGVEQPDQWGSRGALPTR